MDDANDFFIYRLGFQNQTISPVVSILGYYRKDLIYFQTELQYKTIRTRFATENFIDLDNIMMDTRTRVTRHLDVPFVAGIRIDRFKLGVGPTFSFILDDENIFEDVSFFDERRGNFEMGFGFHFGVIIYRLHIDLSYQVRFNQLADYVTWRNVPLGLDQQIQYLDLGMALMF